MRRPLITGVGVLIIAAALVTCVTTTQLTTAPPPPPPAPAVVVPAGCLELQSGAWVHAEDPTWRYQAEDDGGALTLIVHHRVVLDAGFSPRRFRVQDAGLDAGPPTTDEDAGTQDELPSARVELFRTDAGFLGSTLTRFTHPAGTTCDVAFPTRVLGCGDGGLTLETEDSAALGDACQPPARPAETPLRRHHLRREGIDAG